MKYLLIYIWKLGYGIIGIVLVVGALILGMKISKMLTDFIGLQLIIAGAIWIGVIFIVLKPLRMMDKFLEEKASLDQDTRITFFLFVTFVLISLAVFLASIFFFNEWLELINDTIHRTLDDYFTIIFPLVLLIASIASFIGTFNLYKKYKDKVNA
jgi:hypothetical protein